jgi:hypothetical protein
LKPEDQIKKFKEKYDLVIKKAVKEVTKETGTFAFDLLLNRTKAGFGTSGSLKNLSPKYIEFRRKWQSFLADDTDPDTSNLTATGQLLDALFLTVVGSKFFIRVNSKNRSEGLGGEELEAITKDVYKTIKTKSFFGLVNVKEKRKVGTKTTGYQSKLKNSDVRKFVEDAGRVFLEFNQEEKNIIAEFAKELLRQRLSGILNKEV